MGRPPGRRGILGGTTEGGPGWSPFWRRRRRTNIVANLDAAVHKHHVLALDLELLAIFQLHHVPPDFPVEAEDDARLPVVLCSLSESGDLDARVCSKRRRLRRWLCGVVDDGRVQPGVVLWLGGGRRRAGVGEGGGARRSAGGRACARTRARDRDILRAAAMMRTASCGPRQWWRTCPPARAACRRRCHTRSFLLKPTRSAGR